jgi:hypothetical protein
MMLARVEISQALYELELNISWPYFSLFLKWIASERCWVLDLPNFPIQVEDGIITRSVGNEGDFNNQVVNILHFSHSEQG